jgi:RNA polymerase sigma-70 factor (ECF subfamily)
MAPGREPPSTELVDRFVAAFNALDIPALTDLLLENVTTEVLGINAMPGRDAAVSRDGWLQKTLFGHEPWSLDAQKPARLQRAERRLYLGEPIIVVWIQREAGESVEWLFRIAEEEGRVARIRDYCVCPETQAEVAEALGLPLRNWGYRLSDEVLAWEREE